MMVDSDLFLVLGFWRRTSRQFRFECTLSLDTEKCLEVEGGIYEPFLACTLHSDLWRRWRIISQHTSFLACTLSRDPAPCPTHNTASLMAPSSNLLSSDFSPQNERNSTAWKDSTSLHQTGGGAAYLVTVSWGTHSKDGEGVIGIQ